MRICLKPQSIAGIILFMFLLFITSTVKLDYQFQMNVIAVNNHKTFRLLPHIYVEDLIGFMIPLTVFLACL